MNRRLSTSRRAPQARSRDGGGGLRLSHKSDRSMPMSRKHARHPQSLLDLNDRRLIALAGDRSFRRGQAYAAEGRVEIDTCDAQAATATVSGTEDYSVGLEFAEGELEASCECPAFDDDGFCKHLVATVLVAREQLRSGPISTPSDKEPPARRNAPVPDLESFLRTQPAEQLATWLM